MPVYLLQVLSPPIGTLQKIEQLFAKFFWGSTTDHRKKFIGLNGLSYAILVKKGAWASEILEILSQPSLINSGGD